MLNEGAIPGYDEHTPLPATIKAQLARLKEDPETAYQLTSAVSAKTSTQVPNGNQQKKPDYGQRTGLAVDRVSQSPHYLPPDENSPYGYYKGHHIIGRDSTVAGGVYLGGGSREALAVIEDEPLEQIYTMFVKPRIEAANLNTYQVLQTVFQEVRKSMPYSKEIDYEMQNKDGLVPLSKYIQKHGGVCRHQAIFAAYLLERLAKDGLIQGKASSRRNYVQYLGAHAWAQFIDKTGTAYVIDPAQNYCGPFDQSPQHGWMYEGPTPRDIALMHDRNVLELHEVDPVSPNGENPEAENLVVKETIDKIREHVRKMTENYALYTPAFTAKMREFETIVANHEKLDEYNLIDKLGLWHSEFNAMKSVHREWLYESQKEHAKAWSEKVIHELKDYIGNATSWADAIGFVRRLNMRPNETNIILLSDELANWSSDGISVPKINLQNGKISIIDTDRLSITPEQLDQQTLVKETLSIGGKTTEKIIFYATSAYINNGTVTPLVLIAAIKK